MTHGFPTVKFSLIRIKQHTSAESCFLFSSSLERENTITVGYHHGDSRNFLMKLYSHFQCMLQPGKNGPYASPDFWVCGKYGELFG